MMSWLTLLVFLAACGAAAATGALIQPGQWYKTLDKPVWTPPDWLFPVAWTTLYIAMSVAAWRVAYSGAELVPLALALWAWQIALNTLWTPVFFGLRNLFGGMIVLTLLWIAVVSTTVVFASIDTIAGLLMAPYVVWASYAGALNVSVWRRNPEQRPISPGEQVV